MPVVRSSFIVVQTAATRKAPASLCAAPGALLILILSDVSRCQLLYLTVQPYGLVCLVATVDPSSVAVTASTT